MSTSRNSALHRLLVGTVGAGRLFSACLCPPPEVMNVVSAIDTMTDHFYTFNTSPEQLRRLGARGGRAYGRNQRARRGLLATPPRTVPPRAAPPASTAESIAVLDARFPWLRGAEKRLS
jgi:hypothetical protein